MDVPCLIRQACEVTEPVDTWRHERVVFMKVVGELDANQFPDFVADLVSPDSPLFELDPTRKARRLGLMYLDGRFRYATSVKSAKGQQHLQRAVEMGHFTLRVWEGAGKSYHERAQNQHSVGVGFARDNLRVSCHAVESEADTLLDLLIWLLQRTHLNAGGAWGGEPPAWVPQGAHDWLRHHPASMVAGPLWLLVVPEVAHRRLVAVHADESAARVESFGTHGAIWQLAASPAEMTRSVVHRWTDVFDAAGVLPASPPIKRMVTSYFTAEDWRPLLTQWT